MLPMHLLRVRTRKGSIFPLFCTSDEELQLAEDVIREYLESVAKKEKKKFLDDRIRSVEARYDDYKLVRGFCALLERRSQFNSAIPIDSIREKSTNYGENGNNGDNNHNNRINSSYSSDVIVDIDGAGQRLNVVSDGGSGSSTSADPFTIRKALSEESSKMGFALTDFERENIIASIASRLNLSTSYIKQAMWGDLAENLVLEKFDSIGKEQLVAWYNISLMQTLLFNCTRLEFSVHGGTNWKRVLRNLKRLRLMYSLQERLSDKEAEVADKIVNQDGIIASDTNNNTNNTSNAQLELVCAVDGPLSLFKLTDRYGTSIAKLLPSIVSAVTWSLDASIVRKTMSGKKIYQFKISSSEVPGQLWDPYNYAASNNEGVKTGKSSVPQSSLRFDSSVEEKFASKFEQSANGWNLIREPDPIIVSGGKAFIPDFLFEKYGKKIYFEIVGFWTKEYLERKMQKIVDIVSKKKIDLFIAINEDLACSKITPFPTSISSIQQGRVIFYKNDSVPVRAIADYLKAIDKEMIESNVRNPNIVIKFDGTKDIISIDEIASDQNLPVESAIKIALRDNPNNFLNAGPLFISKSKAKQLEELLKAAIKFSDACTILSKNSIPEPFHAELISKLGYDVVWQNIDASTAIIVKRE